MSRPAAPRKRRSTNMSDVAALAGVGMGTVSRVLSGSRQVSAATRTRVLAAAEALGYVPARPASAARLSSGLVGVVIPAFREPSFHHRLQGVIGVLRPHGLRAVLFTVDTPDEARQLLAQIPSSPPLAGLIVMSLPLRDGEGERLAAAPFPVVLLDTVHEGLARITIDDVSGGFLATQHLLDLGHTSIAFVGEPERNPMWFVASTHREEGFRKAMADASLTPADAYFRFGPPFRAAGRQLGTELLALARPPSAVVVASDTQALGVLEAAKGSGRAVPDDLSIIGYDDIELAGLVGLTTVRQPLEASGERAAMALVGAIESGMKPAPFNDVLPLELVVRQTTGRPAGA
jgi:DNA-binding LacI/PurR family transcriptional regulator